MEGVISFFRGRDTYYLDPALAGERRGGVSLNLSFINTDTKGRGHPFVSLFILFTNKERELLIASCPRVPFS